MDHRLLVLRLVERDVAAIFLERLPEPADVPVPEDPERRGDHPPADAVALAPLGLQEEHDRLTRRETDRVLPRARERSSLIVSVTVLTSQLGVDQLGVDQLGVVGWMTTVFMSDIDSIAYLGPSFPKPLCFRPPYGIESARHSGDQLMCTFPTSASRMKRTALSIRG